MGPQIPVGVFNPLPRQQPCCSPQPPRCADHAQRPSPGPHGPQPGPGGPAGGPRPRRGGARALLPGKCSLGCGLYSVGSTMHHLLAQNLQLPHNPGQLLAFSLLIWFWLKTSGLFISFKFRSHCLGCSKPVSRNAHHCIIQSFS